MNNSSIETKALDLVIIADPIISKLTTALALADRLRDEGHNVAVKIPPGRLSAEELVKVGLNVDAGSDLADLRIDPPTYLEPSAETIVDFQTDLKAANADLYLIDAEIHEYVLVALAANLPVALLSVFFNLWKQPNVPPVHQNVIPGSGWRGSRLGIEYGWLGYRVHRLRDVLRSTVLRNDRRHHLRGFARRLGVGPRQTLTEFHGLIPFQYPNLETLTLNLEELELPGGVHRLNHYVGPMPNLAERSTADAKDVLADVDALQSQHPDRKLIYGAFGAYYQGDDLAFWRKAVDAVGHRQDWIGVFGLGGRIQSNDLGPLPDNVRVYDWTPQVQILERADCALIHAGMTSVYECLHHRVPMAVFPLGDSFDQFGTGVRVAQCKIGLVGDRTTASVDDIQSMIDRVLADAKLADRLNQFREAMDRYRDERVLTAAVRSIADTAARR